MDMHSNSYGARAFVNAASAPVVRPPVWVESDTHEGGGFWAQTIRGVNRDGYQWEVSVYFDDPSFALKTTEVAGSE